MAKTILVCGHGPGISDAVARKFGAEGFQVALVARRKDALDAAVAKLAAAGVKAAPFAGDLSDPAAVKGIVDSVRTSLGPIDVLHWNAYSGGAGDLLAAKVADLHAVFDVSVSGLVAAVQAAHADLSTRKGAVLVTGGGLSTYSPEVDAMAVSWKSMGLAIGKAAQHKLVGLLSARLKADGIYVGEFVVMGLVKGTAFDSGNATLEPAAIAQKFWDLQSARAETSVAFG